MNYILVKGICIFGESPIKIDIVNWHTQLSIRFFTSTTFESQVYTWHHKWNFPLGGILQLFCNLCFLGRLLPTSLSYNASTRTNYRLVITNIWINFGISCTPCEHVCILLEANHQLCSDTFWKLRLNLKVLWHVLTKRDRLDITIYDGH